ncbi:hypothetical protein PtB15_2B755 [Puccinia triticina]|nr:hypothetical protein PtB15_2B755 [Puccinia triticina]
MYSNQENTPRLTGNPKQTVSFGSLLPSNSGLQPSFYRDIERTTAFSQNPPQHFGHHTTSHFYHQGSYSGNGTRYPHSAPGPITDHHHKASRGVIYPAPKPTCSSLDPVGDRPRNPPPQPSAKPQPKKQRKKQAATSGSTTRTAATAPRKNPPKPTLEENAPAADGCHHPLPASIRSGVITKLEGAANESCSLNLPPNADDPSRNNPTPSLHVDERSRNNPAPSLQQGLRSAPPLEGVSDPLPRKNKKCNRSQGEDGRKVLPAPRS